MNQNLAGKVALITGATAGIGWETTKYLAARGAHVIMAVRNPQKAAARLAELSDSGLSNASWIELDTSRRDTVRDCAQRIQNDFDHLDIVILNAGISQTKTRQTTSDGNEMILATNVLGHFELIQLLQPRLSGSRVVWLGSMMAHQGVLHLPDLDLMSHWTALKAYCQSKLACVILATELGRRSDEAGWGITSVSAHPGWAMTMIGGNGDQPHLGNVIAAPLLQRLKIMLTAEEGAKPIMFAATEAVEQGCFYGPKNMLNGPASLVKFPRQALCQERNAALWRAMERKLS